MTAVPLLRAEENPAVLIRGPLTVEGIDFLPLNAITGWYGEYEYGTSRAAVYFVQEELLVIESWEAGRCGSYVLYSFSIPSRTVQYYRDQQGWSLFISTDDEISDPCPFISAFIRRFRYFQGIAKNPKNISFPAVLELE